MDTSATTNLKPQVRPPPLKMKRVPVFGQETPGTLIFTNSAKRLIVEMTIPHATYCDQVDVTIGPNATLDELACVIAELLGSNIFHQYQAKVH